MLAMRARSREASDMTAPRNDTLRWRPMSLQGATSAMLQLFILTLYARATPKTVCSQTDRWTCPPT
eukprot:31772-Pleurochrysis_carterae.AAC.6